VAIKGIEAGETYVSDGVWFINIFGVHVNTVVEVGVLDAASWEGCLSFDHL